MVPGPFSPGVAPAWILCAAGDTVLEHNEGPRGRWPLARVTGLIEGTDGHPRAAHIEMRGIKTRRPLNRLYQLEARN